jgi:hypothetical protein
MERRKEMPANQLSTNRSIIKYILLSIITFGIYALVIDSIISSDINTIASRYDGKNTVHYCLVVFVFGPLTLGIYGLIWYHQVSNRIGNELERRGIGYNFSASDFWLWGILGTFIFIGPIVYKHKMLTAMNLLAEDYNIKG